MEVETLDIPQKIIEDFEESGITELNPPQRDAIDSGLLEGEDLIVASPTASGKTLIAEIAMSKSVIENEKTAVYIVPLKALASEKFQDFKERFEEQNVRISVGNHDDSGEDLSNADIVIATSEKLDSLMRHNPSWIHDVGLVVVDEIHLITSPERGPTLEVTIARLRDILDFQLLGLSATISNSGELADWLDSKLVESTYRPVELKEGVYWDNEVEFYREEQIQEHEKEVPEPGDSLEGTEVGGFTTGKEVKEDDDGQNIEPESYFVEDKHGRGSLNIIQDTLDIDKQAIVFCSSRKGAEKSSDRSASITSQEISREEGKKLKDYAERIENALGNPTSQCKRLAENVRKGAAFHHAGLCVSGDSVIMHSDGSFSRMDNLIGNDKETALGLSDYSLKDTKIRKKYEIGEKAVLEIKTGRGRSIKVSKNHQLPALTEEGLEWRKSKNLSERDRIATPRKIDLDAETPKLRKLLRDEVITYRKNDAVDELVKKIDTEELDQNFRKRYRDDGNISVGDLREICEELVEDPEELLDVVMSKAGQKPVKIPEELDEDIAWLIGAVAGDGHIDSSSVHLSGSEDSLHERFEVAVRQKFERTVSITEREKDDVKTYYFSSKAVSDILYDYFGIPREKKAQNLKMPDIALPDELMAAYIQGLFDTDGSVNCRENSEGTSCIEFYTANRQLATELHMSLLRFGINAHRDRRKTEGRKTRIGEHQVRTNEDMHRLKIYGIDQLRKYRDEIGFSHPAKKSRLEEAIEINPEGGRRQNDVIPEKLGNRARKIRRQKGLSLSDLEPEVPKSTVSRFENHKKPMKRETFQKLAEKLEDRELQKIANSEIYWTKIEQIEEKEPEKLYDISTSTENFLANGIIAHNTTEQRELVEEAFRKGLVKTVSATPTLAAGVNLPAFRVIMRDLKRYTGQGMEYIPTLEYEQMSGRAGRPKYDDRGEAISIAKQPGIKEEIVERYILGESEHIQSKLAAEPVLRMHTLSLVASGFCTSLEGLLEFYSETLYAHQYGDLSDVEQQVRKVVEDLETFGFLKENNIEATKTGKRVSELYIDPESAYKMIKSLKKAENKDTKSISYLYMICRTTEIRNLRAKEKEYQDYAQALLDGKDYLLEEVPNEWEPGYDSAVEAMKTALMFEAWISELDEERIMEKFDAAPGGVRSKTRNADWLLYSARELARLKEIDVEKEIKKLRVRLKHGIEEELLSLVNYDQIGRVRARKLHENGIKNQKEIREVSFEKLKKLIGDRTAKKLKKQVGEDNIFDRENIMDYFDE